MVNISEHFMYYKIYTLYIIIYIPVFLCSRKQLFLTVLVL